MSGLAPQQHRALTFIAAYHNRTGCSPSYEEIGEGVGIKGKAGVNRIVEALEDRGMLRRLPGRARSLTVVTRVPDAADLARLSDADLTLLANRLEIETFARKRAAALERVL